MPRRNTFLFNFSTSEEGWGITGVEEVKTFSVLLFFSSIFFFCLQELVFALPNLGVFTIFSFVCRHFRFFLIIGVCSNILREGGEQI